MRAVDRQLALVGCRALYVKAQIHTRAAAIAVTSVKVVTHNPVVARCSGGLGQAGRAEAVRARPWSETEGAEDRSGETDGQ